MNDTLQTRTMKILQQELKLQISTKFEEGYPDVLFATKDLNTKIGTGQIRVTVDSGGNVSVRKPDDKVVSYRHKTPNEIVSYIKMIIKHFEREGLV